MHEPGWSASRHLAGGFLLLTLAFGFSVQAQEDTAAQETEAPPRAEEAPIEEAADGGVLLEDYEASEQISEDLSVSFPVDI
jgi:hypothetical protein